MCKHRYEIHVKIMNEPNEPTCICEVIARDFIDAINIIRKYMRNTSIEKIEKMEQVNANADTGVMSCVLLKMYNINIKK